MSEVTRVLDALRTDEEAFFIFNEWPEWMADVRAVYEDPIAERGAVVHFVVDANTAEQVVVGTRALGHQVVEEFGDWNVTRAAFERFKELVAAR